MLFNPAEPLATPGVSPCELETRFHNLELSGVVSGSQKKVAAAALPSELQLPVANRFPPLGDTPAKKLWQLATLFGNT